jgi:hypothetical protein
MDKRTAWGLIAALVIGIAASDAGAVCGDGIVDGFEWCDHGAANGVDGCCGTDCRPIDRDGDAICDPDDACSTGDTPFDIKEPSVVWRLLDHPTGTHRFRVKGTVVVVVDPLPRGVDPDRYPPIDPATNGFRFSAFHTTDHISTGVPGTPLFAITKVADAVAPGGPGWSARADGRAWTYHASAIGHDITRVVVKEVALPPALWVPGSSLVVRAFSFVVDGRNADYTFTPGIEMALHVSVSLDASRVDKSRCGEKFFSFPPQGETTWGTWFCTLSSSGKTSKCGPAPRLGPCHVGDPNDMVVCDIQNAADAAQAYFAATGTYYTGPCSGLPGFTPTPGVTCTVSGPSTYFNISISASRPGATRWCYWFDPEATCSDGTVSHLCCD